KNCLTISWAFSSLASTVPMRGIWKRLGALIRLEPGVMSPSSGGFATFSSGIAGEKLLQTKYFAISTWALSAIAPIGACPVGAIQHGPNRMRNLWQRG